MGQQAGTVVVTALVLAGGIILGATLFRADPPAATEARDDPMLEGASPTPGWLSESARDEVLLESSADLTQVLQRIAALEAEVQSLRTRHAQDQAAMKPLVEMYEQARASGLLQAGVGGGLPEGTMLVDELAGGGAANQLIGAMELDEERAKAFRAEHKRVLAAAADLEKRNAQVRVDGDTTTIQIDAFGADGEALRRGWEDWKRDNWTTDEQTAYKKGGGDNTVFGARLGVAARTIRIKESGGSIRLVESSAASENEQLANEIMGPAAARDLILQDYAHLLK